MTILFLNCWTELLVKRKNDYVFSAIHKENRGFMGLNDPSKTTVQ